MKSNQIRRNAAGAIIHNDINNHPYLNTPVATVKNNDGSIQAYRLPLELENWVLSCMHAASVEKNPFPCKVAFGIINNKFHVEFKR
ncbi:hypothetical protein [Bacillus thuringiensis]|uniref:hypothetical protein n=1 Tax=Bacillus thuringiensis TaxID=1428 RepID=UPI000BFDE782|nr:hypothetical protein [Bacillus thuringiensis]PGO53052.1 hypothetical protein CN986_21165 [Bacillus thuringiensis]